MCKLFIVIKRMYSLYFIIFVEFSKSFELQYFIGILNCCLNVFQIKMVENKGCRLLCKSKILIVEEFIKFVKLISEEYYVYM